MKPRLKSSQPAPSILPVYQHAHRLSESQTEMHKGSECACHRRACRQRRKRARGGEHLKVGCRVARREEEQAYQDQKAPSCQGGRFLKERLSRRSSASGQTDVGRGWVTKSPLDRALGFLVILLKASSLGSWGGPQRGRTRETGGWDGREMGFQKLGQEIRRQDSCPRQKAGFCRRKGTRLRAFVSQPVREEGRVNSPSKAAEEAGDGFLGPSPGSEKQGSVLRQSTCLFPKSVYSQRLSPLCWFLTDTELPEELAWGYQEGGGKLHSQTNQQTAWSQGISGTCD